MADETQRRIRGRIWVTSTEVAEAEELILDVLRRFPGGIDSGPLIVEVVKAARATLSAQVFTKPEVDPSADIVVVANHLSWRLAAIEAILGLVHRGALVPTSVPVKLKAIEAHYLRGHLVGGTTLEFEETSICVPGSVRLAPLRAGRADPGRDTGEARGRP